MSTTSDSALVAELAGQASGSVLGPHEERYAGPVPCLNHNVAP